MLYIVFSYGIPEMIHGVFDKLETAEKVLRELQTTIYKDNYTRLFYLRQLKLNEIYKSGAPFV